MWAAYGILSALYRRERVDDPVAERVELGMLDSMIPWLTKHAGKSIFENEPTWRGTHDPVLALYQSFPTANGHVNVACGNQRLWERLCEAIDREDLLEDPRFETNRHRVDNLDALEKELPSVCRQRKTKEWIDLLAEEHGVPVAP